MGWVSDIANIAGKVLDIDALKDNQSKQTRLQRQFAQEGIRWKVADAKAAGIAPLAALGAQTISYQPMQVGGGYGDALGLAGQSLDRAIDATRTQEERDHLGAFIDQKVAAQNQRDTQAKLDRSFALDMQHKELQNTLLASQIMGLHRAQNPPLPSGDSPPEYVPAPGSANVLGDSGIVLSRKSAPATGAVLVKPSELTSRAPGDPSRTAGVDAAFDRFTFGDSRLDLPTNKLSQALEDMGLLKYYLVGKRFFENMRKDREPRIQLPPGYHWEFNYRTRHYEAVRNK